MFEKPPDEQAIYSRIGIIGDIHAEDALLSSSLLFLENQSVQVILCVGDIVDGMGDVNACCELLYQHNVMVVRGNHDHWILNYDTQNLPNYTIYNNLSEFSKQYIKHLTFIKELRTRNGLLLLCHGIGKNYMGQINANGYGNSIEAHQELQEIYFSSRYQFMINGHSHQKMIRKFNELIVINAGTLNLNHDACIVVLDIEKDIADFFNFSDQNSIQKQESIFLSKIPSKQVKKY
jgi:predicted phosphodiesterase